MQQNGVNLEQSQNPYILSYGYIDKDTEVMKRIKEIYVPGDSIRSSISEISETELKKIEKDYNVKYFVTVRRNRYNDLESSGPFTPEEMLKELK